MDGRYFCIGGLVLGLVGLILKQRASLLLAAIFTGAALMALQTETPSLPQSGSYALEAVVQTAQLDAENTCRMLLEDAALDGQPNPGRILCYVRNWEGALPQRGDRIGMQAYVYPAAENGSVSAFTWRGYTLRMKIWLGASAQMEDYRLLETGEWSLRRSLDGLRAMLAERIEDMYPQDMAQLVKSLTLGVRDELPEEISGAFTSAGVVHLLALSGLHVSLLAALWEFLLKRTPIAPGAAFGLVLGGLGLYALMVGAPASILRAVVMYAIGGWGRLRKRPSDTITSLSAAFLALTLFSPTRALDAGLLLSFTSILGMLCLTPPAAWLRFYGMKEPVAKVCRAVIQSLLASLGATLGTMPIVAGMYEKIHLYGILANMVVVPVASLALPLAFMSVILGAIWTGLGMPFAVVAGWLLRAVIWMARQVEGWPWAAVYVRAWNGWLIPLFAGNMFLISPYVHSPRKSGVIRGIGLLCAVGVAAVAMFLPLKGGDSIRIRFLDVGQADAAVLQIDDRVYVLDTGMDDTCAAYLTDRGLQVDGLFLTHPHDDHAGGAEAVLKTQKGTLYVPANWAQMEADSGLDELPRQAEAYGWQVEYLSAGDELPLGENAFLHTLWPMAGYTDTRANEGCMVLHLRFGQADALFLSDKSADVNLALPDVELVKVAHHGAKGGTSRLTASATTPELAVISVGRNNYGHPNANTIACFEEYDALILRTDRDGDILVDLDADGSVRYWIHPK